MAEENNREYQSEDPMRQTYETVRLMKAVEEERIRIERERFLLVRRTGDLLFKKVIESWNRI